MSNNTSWVVIIGLVVAMIAAISVTAIVVDGYRDCQYIKAGYTKKMLPGCACPAWVKEGLSDCSKNVQAPGLDPRNWVVSEPVPLSNAAGGDR